MNRLALFFLFLSVFPNTLLDKQSTTYVELNVLQGEVGEDEIDLVFQFRVRPPYHINSGSPLIEGLIPTTVEFPGSPLTVKTKVYPPDEILDISGFRTTVYFNGPHDLEVTLSGLSGKSKKGGKNLSELEYVFHYQACKDDECYAPEEIRGTLTLATGSTGSPIPPALLWMILFSFLGGVILNFTPCVLPILSLKLLSLSSMREAPGAGDGGKKRFAVFHILGVMVFFILIALGVILLKMSGEEIGWGFQFQNPHYIFFITLVLGVVTLNLLGGFEIPFSYQSKIKPSKYGENLKHLGTGFLSVLLATPCTVPFLGIAAAYSFSQGTGEILLLHAFTGMGFSFPYALIFFGIDISKLIPRLRPFERYIKKVLGFVVILTIIWLVDIYGTLTGEGMLILAALWLTSFLLWGHGEVQKRHSSKRWEVGFWTSFLLLSGILIFYSAPVGEAPRLANTSNLEGGEGRELLDSSSALQWEKFSKRRLEELIAAPELVYVHFTADWCLNCKVNEKLIINSDAVVELFGEYRAVLLKADWTKSDDEIFTEIQSLGRAGIPLDVIYYQDKKIILNSILTVGEIESALRELTEIVYD